MYLTAFLHRDRLYQITNRWLSDRLAPQDPLEITKIITYDSIAAWETLLDFADDLLSRLTRSTLHQKKITDKKELKDLICDTPFKRTERIRALIAQYREMSEFYYIGSPIAGYVYFDHTPRIVGFSRFKRVKRIAEKASRYASIYLSKEVQSAALQIERQRAALPADSPGQKLDQMLNAEEAVMRRIKENGLVLPEQRMRIQDILGVKVIDSGFGEAALESAIARYRDAEIIEKEKHSGDYNAVHYIIELRVDFDRIIKGFVRDCRSVDYRSRGLPRNGLEQDFIDFVKTGSDTIELDLILTTFEELIESEIGRSMHETRIFKQRQQRGFLGNIPINVEYIIEYLLAVGLSPETEIDEIPIKIWGRYLPDTLSYRIRKLYGMPEYCLVKI